MEQEDQIQDDTSGEPADNQGAEPSSPALNHPRAIYELGYRVIDRRVGPAGRPDRGGSCRPTHTAVTFGPKSTLPSGGRLSAPVISEVRDE